MKNIKRTLASMLAIMMLMTSVPAMSVEAEDVQAAFVDEVVEAALVDEIVEEAEESLLPMPEEEEELPSEDEAPVVPQMVLMLQDMEGVMVAEDGYYVTDIEIGGAAIVHEKTTLQLTAKIVPEDADVGTVYWKSSNNNVATVNNDGVVTTKAVDRPRTVTITAYAADEGAFEAEFELTVVPIALATEVVVSGVTNEVGVKKSIKLTADVLSGADKASIQAVTWNSSSSKIATVSSSGVVKGVKAGKAYITATAKDGSKVVSQKFEVVVKSKAASSVKVTAVNADGVAVTAVNAYETDKTLQLKAAVSSSSASQKVAWSVDAKYAEIADVDETGLLTIADDAYGEIVVKASALDGSGKSGTLTINVFNTVSSIDIEAPTTEVAPKKAITLYAWTNAEDGMPSIDGVTWKSMKTSVAKVTANADGSVKVTGVKAGTADIVATAKDGSGVTETITVTVMQKAVSSVKINADIVPFIDITAEDKTIDLAAVVSPATASQNIFWSIGDDYLDIATIEEGNVLTATGDKTGIVPVKVSALDGSGKSATMYVHVGKPADEIKIVGADSVALKKSVTLTPYLIVGEEGEEKEYLTCGAKGSVVSGSSYATVKFNNDGTITVTGKKAGKVVIKVESYADASVYAEYTVNVKKSVSTLKISGAKNFILNEMPVDEETGNLVHGEETNYLLTAVEGATWSSSNPGLISVDEEGRVMLEKCVPGTVTIKAEKDGKVGTVIIKALYKTEEIALSAELIDDEGVAHVVKGASTKLIADVYPMEADNTALTWKSSSTKTATVSSAGVVKGVKAGSVTITATPKDGGAEKATIKVVVHDAPTSVALTSEGTAVKSGSVLYLYNVGDTLDLTATVKPSKAYQVVEWTSNNEDVASIEDGVITVNGRGTAKITAKTIDGKNKSAYVYVVVGTPADEVIISGERSVTIGKSITLTAEVLPADAANKAVTWKLAEESKGIASVSSSGVVKGLKQGYAKIIAESDVEGVEGEYYVYVAPKSTKVHIYNGEEEITGKTANFYRNLGNGTMQLSARLDPVDADQSVTWKSSSTSIATVDANGVVTAKKNGTVTITATAADGSKKYATAKLKISTINLSVEIVSEDNVTELTAGTQTLLSAIITPEEQAALGVEWAVDNEEIATVDQDGVVTANEGVVGEVVVTATCNGVVAEYILKVVLPPETVEIAEPETTLIDMNSDVQTIQLNASVAPEGASQRIIWESLNEEVATVDAKGLVTAVDSGEATIVAKHADVQEITDEITIKVVKLPKALELTVAETRLYAGEVAELKAVLTPEVVDNDELVWTTTDENVTVEPLDGNYVVIVGEGVTAVKEVTLTATTAETLDDVEASIKVTVSSIEAVFEVDGTTITKFIGTETDVRIPSSITKIAKGAFDGCGKDVKISIDEDQEIEIESGALTGLSGMADENGFLVLSGRLITYAGDEAVVVVPKEVTRIDDGAFEGNTKITKVTLPNTVTVIGKRAFAGCTNLSEMECLDPDQYA